jgi:hypothetical protein
MSCKSFSVPAELSSITPAFSGPSTVAVPESAGGSAHCFFGHTLRTFPWQFSNRLRSKLLAALRPGCRAIRGTAGRNASLLTAEVEALAEERKWGTAVSATAVPAADPDGELANPACRSDRRRLSQRRRVARRRSAALRHRAGDAVARARRRVAGIGRYAWPCARPDTVSGAHPAGWPWPGMVYGRHGGARGR